MYERELFELLRDYIDAKIKASHTYSTARAQKGAEDYAEMKWSHFYRQLPQNGKDGFPYCDPDKEGL